jgi:hypothetical protein
MRWTHEEDFDALINAAADRHGVPAALVRAIIGNESQFNPSAWRPEPAIGDGSAGLMQILLGTAKGVGYGGPLGDRLQLTGLFDPATNIEYGTAYLAQQYDMANSDIRGAASAYNGGWRPSIGFGAPADHAMTITLARDPVTGNPIRTRQVKPGEFSNQPYVDAVLSNYAYFTNKEAASTGVTQFVRPLTPTGTFNPKLVGLLVGLLIALFGLRSRQRRQS